MEVFLPLSEFFESVANDARVGTTHISLFMVLFHEWNLSNGINPFSIERDSIMKMAKINSRQTYNQCMADLHELGYIIYKPALNAAVRSQVSLKYCNKVQ